jgi:NAD(P)H dehydrogenase (quinone)
MPSVAIVYHSGFGHTKVIAEAIHRGAASIAGITAHLIPVADLPSPGADRKLTGPAWDILNAADAIVFGSPTYMGDVSAEFRRFAEATGGLWFAQAWKDKLAAGFVNSGGLSGDKLQALQALAVLAAQHSMIWIPTGIPTNGSTPEHLNRLGSYSGLMTQADNASPEITPPQGDRKTAELFGQRIANATIRWTKGNA